MTVYTHAYVLVYMPDRYIYAIQRAYNNHKASCPHALSVGQFDPLHTTLCNKLDFLPGKLFDHDGTNVQNIVVGYGRRSR